MFRPEPANDVQSPASAGLASSGAVDHPLAEEFRQFVRETTFPCVGAKSALATDGMFFIIASDIGSTWDDLHIHHQIARFVKLAQWAPDIFKSCVLLFEKPVLLDESAFEQALWRRLQSLSDKDGWLGFAQDEKTSTDPDNADFALSFAGESFFAVGLHPGASRPARRFRTPAIVFNLHKQFRKLRAEGRYEKMRATILSRDEKLAGSVNPMVARHGEISEARQYSGREVDDGWRCPFHRNATPAAIDDAA